MSAKSTLHLDGRDIEVKSLDLDGTLIVKAAPGAHVVIDDLKVENEGWVLDPISGENGDSISEALR